MDRFVESVECRTCLKIFANNDILHVNTEVIKQKNVIQAIKEVASIEVLENDGFPEHICTNCFRSLESSISFRTQIISSDTELKKRLLPGINDEKLFIKSQKEENDENLLNIKEEDEACALLEKKEIIFPKEQIKADDNTGVKSPEHNSENEWNDFNNDNVWSDNSFNEEVTREPLNSINESQKDEIDLNQKSLSASKRHWTDFSDDTDSSDNFFADKSKNESSKTQKKTTVYKSRKIHRKRKVTRKPIEDISCTSDSEGDSDIPLVELRKEIKELESKVDSKVRKKRGKKEEPDGPRLCPICGKLFKARQNYNSHMTTVHRNKRDKEKISCLCPDCGRVITGTRQNFVAHRRYHHSDKAQVKKRFTCDICPRKFYREKNLMIHERIHKGEKGYVCELCPDKSYTQIGGLILHKRKVHLKKPTCTCNYCGKQFYEKHYLETHIRQWHTGERPFSCEICGKSFSCNGTLLRHRKDSHGEKQPCPKCGKMYTEGELRKHLKRHKIREEGIKRKKYTCEYCGTEMNFTSRKRHLLKQHGIMLRGRGETAERIPISRADTM